MLKQLIIKKNTVLIIIVIMNQKKKGISVILKMNNFKRI